MKITHVLLINFLFILILFYGITHLKCERKPKVFWMLYENLIFRVIVVLLIIIKQFYILRCY